MIENILIIDTETTGLDPSKGSKLIEVGAILFNVKHKQILQQFSTLFPCEENPVQDINGIDPALKQVKIPFHFTVALLSQMADHAQALVAHNAEFDRKFMATIDPQPTQPFDMRRWICTKKDFKWPTQLYRNRLQDVCVAMGVAYDDAHRALNDCHFIAKCFSKVADLESRLNSAGRNNFTNSAKFR